MGDRASILIRQDDKISIEIYGHWAGVNIVNTLPHALEVAKGRYDDIPYFTRIVTQNILDDIADKDKETSAGLEISNEYESNHDDLNNNLVIIDPFNKLVMCEGEEFSFDDIIANGVEKLQQAMRFEY